MSFLLVLVAGHGKVLASEYGCVSSTSTFQEAGRDVSHDLGSELPRNPLDTECTLTRDQVVPLEPGDPVRPYTSADGPAVVALVVAAGMFSQEEAAFLADGVLDRDPDRATCLVEDADGRGLASVLFYRPEESADRAYDLTMIAVRPDLQGGGRGAALMRHAEDDLRQREQRLLLVRTSGTAQYDATRAFYRSLGYTEASRVADYWTDGDDLVMFSKRLAD